VISCEVCVAAQPQTDIWNARDRAPGPSAAAEPVVAGVDLEAITVLELSPLAGLEPATYRGGV
jgi:hypothetical protein